MTIFRIIPLLLLTFFCSFDTIDAPTFDPNAELVNWRQNGVLLVRFRTQENRIKSLHRQGESLAAKDLAYERWQYHHALREAFRDHFNFSQVYFFFNRDAHRVLAGDYAGFLFDVNGRKIKDVPTNKAAYMLDSYFPHHPHFTHHRDQKEGFVIKKISAAGIGERISTMTPYTFSAPTQLNTAKHIQRLQKRVRDLNKILWERFAVANLKVTPRKESILVQSE